ncbi:MAG: phosphonate ABC transporter, permease protein PhnE [Bdellovibrionaceae bacterium]|nr:phosphonate ABC transporter, permease protein PhnE [Pseudobdellovibrionaceae bacterium]
MTKRTIFDSILFAYFFCVAMLAIFAPSQAEMLNLGRNTLVFAIGLVLGAMISYGLNKASLKTLGELIFEPAYKKASAEEVSWTKQAWSYQLILFLVITFTVGSIMTKFSLTELLDEDGFAGAARLFKGLASPNMDLLPRAVLNIIETIFMAFMATALAIPIAFVLCFFCAKNIMKGPVGFAVYLILRTFLNVTRSIEALIWAIIFSVWVGIGPFAGMLALMIHSIASLAKQYSEIVETVNEGPIEGIMSTGATRLQTIWFAIVPQVVLPFISFTVYRWDINIRMATIIGLVGGGGIGTLLIQYQGQAMWPEVGTIILVIAFVVWFMDTASAYLREALK